jgi:hypothetical protein
LATGANACDGPANNYTGGRIGTHSTTTFAAIGGVLTVSDSVAYDFAGFTTVLFALAIDAGVTGFTGRLFDADTVYTHLVRTAAIGDTGAALFMLPSRTRVFGTAHAIDAGFISPAFGQTGASYLVSVGIARAGTGNVSRRWGTDETTRPRIGGDKAHRIAGRACAALRLTRRVNGYGERSL